MPFKPNKYKETKCSKCGKIFYGPIGEHKCFSCRNKTPEKKVIS